MPLILELEDEEPPMVASDFTLAVQSPTLKREERKRLQHGPHFSKWKVLVAPGDWEDYSAGKDGAERYRVQNLPGNESPGVYELGVAVPHSGSGRGIKADQIVPVYVGQADSARTRLQQYGRTGAHLGRSCSGNPSEQICKGPGLIEEMLDGGYSIVYRWAPMGTKSEAERTESQLLHALNYAWNTRFNGARRPDDVLQKLKKISSNPTLFTIIVPRPLPSRQKQVDIRINSSNLVSTEDKFSNYADRESRNIIPQVFKFGRSQPRLVLDGSGTWENTIICGVAVGDGSICRKAPVQGRKRCAEHKGTRITGLITASNADSKCSFISNRELVSYKSGITQENTEICGVAAGDGSTCRRPPVQGRQRCAEHKGMRITGSITASNVDSKCSFISNRESVSYRSGITQENTEICGACTNNGSACRRPPVPGNKRCAVHKGMRITGSTTASNVDSKCSFISNDRESVSYKSGITQENTEICGACTNNGSACRRPPVPGNKRCAVHKGMRITGSTTASNVDSNCSFISNREFASYNSGITWENTGICGATTNNGSACRRPPVQGRKRCAVHKGRRI
ncbi:protein EFFECTOR OF TRANSCRIPTION 2-like [Rosa rugosa]|uniref:protein EFFECTOR OF TRANSCRIPTION 2-like n=1 Tax=Rosa rugosa TaxID=74645 RepID=UPI002B40CE6D|nr:protein EFFECTOR OF TRANSCRIPTION 2-like [Rosa rugosa]